MTSADRLGAVPATQQAREVSMQGKPRALGAPGHRPHPGGGRTDRAAAHEAVGIRKQHQGGSTAPPERILRFGPKGVGHPDLKRSLIGRTNQGRPAQQTVLRDAHAPIEWERHGDLSRLIGFAAVEGLIVSAPEAEVTLQTGSSFLSVVLGRTMSSARSDKKIRPPV